MPGSRRSVKPPSSEQGFVLVAAIWLLVLGGSIAAILMLRSLSSATVRSDHEERLDRQLALESAIETVMADRQFNGVRSAWWLVPGEGQVEIDGRAIRIRLSSEIGRIDVNEAEPALVDAILRASGKQSTERNHIMASLHKRRSGAAPLGSYDELRALLGRPATAQSDCLLDLLAIGSGLAAPRADQMPPELARILGQPISAAPGQLPPGAAIRIDATPPTGPARVAILRLSGTIFEPLAMSRWEVIERCGKV